VDEPAISETWNDLTLGVFQEGAAFVMKSEMMAMYEKILGIELPESVTVTEGFALISKGIIKKYGNGICSRVMLRS
jgi:hypothetical protein